MLPAASRYVPPCSTTVPPRGAFATALAMLSFEQITMAPEGPVVSIGSLAPLAARTEATVGLVDVPGGMLFDGFVVVLVGVGLVGSDAGRVVVGTGAAVVGTGAGSELLCPDRSSYETVIGAVAEEER